MHLPRFLPLLFLLCALVAVSSSRAETEAQLNERFTAARAKADAGKEAEALEDCNFILEQAPHGENVWKLRALLKWRLKDMSGARADIAQALSLEPADAEAYRIRAGIKYQQEQLAEAIADMDKAIELAPDNGEFLCARGQAYLTQGVLEPALRDLDRAIEAAPTLVVARYFRAQVQEALDNPEAALADYDFYLEWTPQDSAAREKRAWLRFHEGNWDGAMEDARKGLELAPQDASITRAAGYAEFARGNYAAAIPALTHAADLAGDDEEQAAYALFIRYYAQRRVGSADDRLARAAGGWKQAAWQREIAGFLTGRLTEEQLDTLAESPEDEADQKGRLCEANFYIGMARLLAGDRSSARLRFQASIGTGVKSYIEYTLAGAELERLKKK